MEGIYSGKKGANEGIHLIWLVLSLSLASILTRNILRNSNFDEFLYFIRFVLSLVVSRKNWNIIFINNVDDRYARNFIV